MEVICTELLSAKALRYFSSARAHWLAIFTLPVRIFLWAAAVGAIEACDRPVSQTSHQCRHVIGMCPLELGSRN